MKKIFIGVCVTAVIFYGSIIYLHTDTSITQDLGRHLLLGEMITKTGTVPSTNLFSFTEPSFPFVNHHWGSEVIFYIVHSRVGINGLIILKVIIAALAFIILVMYASRKNKEVITLISTSIVSVGLLRERTEIRPEVIGYFLFSIFLVILYSEKLKRRKLIWILPILIIIWVNAHISFAFGIFLYVLFLLDRLLVGQLKKRYMAVGLLMLFSTVINPSGIEGALYPLKIFSNYGYSIVENQSPFFLETLFKNETISYMKLSFLSILIVTPFLLKRKQFLEWGSMVFLGVLSSFAIRHFPFFGLSIIFPLSLGGGILIQNTKSLLLRVFKIQLKYFTFFSTLLLLFFMFYNSYLFVSNKYYQNKTNGMHFGLGQVSGMKETMDFFIVHKMSGPLFNNFDVGSYLTYRLYPGQRVFVDGRPEAYTSDFFQKVYIPMQTNRKMWDRYSKEYGIQVIVFGHTDNTPWARDFLKDRVVDPDWKMAYFDESGVIFIRNDTVTDTIQPLSSSEAIFLYGKMKLDKATTLTEVVGLGHFFSIVKFEALEKMAYDKMLLLR